MSRHEEGIQLRHANELLMEFWLAWLEEGILLDDDLRDRMQQYQSDYGQGWPDAQEVAAVNEGTECNSR
jgi:hypothetical protein